MFQVAADHFTRLYFCIAINGENSFWAAVPGLATKGEGGRAGKYPILIIHPRYTPAAIFHS